MSSAWKLWRLADLKIVVDLSLVLRTGRDETNGLSRDIPIMLLPIRANRAMSRR